MNAPRANVFKNVIDDSPVMSYCGIISQVVVQTNDPQCYVGQVFSGYYQYESVGIDGAFYVSGLLDPSATNKSLTGLVCMPSLSPAWQPYPLRSTPNDGCLKVQNGVVQDFTWSWQQGDCYAEFSKNSFRVQTIPASGDATVTTGVLVLGSVLRQA